MNPQYISTAEHQQLVTFCFIYTPNFFFLCILKQIPDLHLLVNYYKCVPSVCISNSFYLNLGVLVLIQFTLFF